MRRLLERTALDARSLAVCRIGVGLLLLVDLAQRAFDLRAFYTDEGVLPRSAFQLSYWDFAWSAHRWGGSAVYEAALFAVAAVFALALLLGYRTCWATLGSWLFAVSLHGRNPLLRDGQDDLMRVLLFWALFLPWGAVASLDARAGRRAHPLQSSGTSVASWGALGFVLQLCVVYWVSGLGKLLSPWWQSGDGIFYAMHVGRYQTGLGRWLGEQPGLPFLSFAVMALELGGPIAWLALRDGRARAGVAAAFILMHAGFVATIRLGLFPWVSMVAWTALLPPWVWERLGWRAALADLPAPRALLLRISAGAALAAGLIVVWCNVLYMAPEAGLPRWPQRVADGVGLQQYWVLFSPRRSSPFALSDGWLVVAAVLKDGEQVDPQRGGEPLSWERPPLISTSFPNARWRHYFANMANLLLPFPPRSLQFQTLEQSRAAFAHWLCREWNAGHPESRRISYLSVFLMRYRFDHRSEEAQRELLYQDACLER